MSGTTGTTVTNGVNHESDARFDTTAAWAAAETSTMELQRDVEKNAAKAHDAAEAAAAHAPFKAPATQGAVDKLEEDLAEKTHQAVLDGQSSVDQAKAAGVGYVESAKNLANSALSTAASYIPGGGAGSTTTTDKAASTNGTGTGVVASLQSAAGTAINTAANVLSSAGAAAAPHLEAAKNTVTSAVSGATGTTTTNGSVTSKPAEVPPSTAPLETAGGVGGPYHKTTGNNGVISEGPTGIATV